MAYRRYAGYHDPATCLFEEKLKSENRIKDLLRQFAIVRQFKREQQEWQRGMEVGLVVNGR